MKLLYLLPLLVVGWIPSALGDTGAANFSEYVYLHVTRSEAASPAQSCRGKAQPTRN